MKNKKRGKYCIKFIKLLHYTLRETFILKCLYPTLPFKPVHSLKGPTRNPLSFLA